MIYITALHFACASGNLESVKYIIGFNMIDINSRDIYLMIFYIVFLSIFL